MKKAIKWLLLITLLYTTFLLISPNKQSVIPVDTMSADYMLWTRLDLRNEIRRRINDNQTDTSNIIWSDATLNDRINLVQDEMCRFTRCIEVQFSTWAVTGQQEYTYPDDMIIPFRISFMVLGSTPPAYKKLEWNSLAILDSNNSSWESSVAGLPTKYYERGNIYGIVPPASAIYTSTNTYPIRINYFGRAKKLTVDTDHVFNGISYLYPYNELIVQGVVVMCLRDRGVDVTNIETKYYTLLKSMADDIKLRPDAKFQR